MFRESVTVGRPFGIRVDVSVTWLLVCALLTWMLGAQHLPSRLPTWPAPLIWAGALTGSLSFFLSVVLHEAAHVLAAYHVGVRVRVVSLFLFGGISQARRDAVRPSDELAIAIVGPLANLALGMLAGVGYVLAGDAPLALLLAWLALVNVSLGLFNLLPWLPLDGGRLLRGLAWFASDDPRWANRVALLAGQLSAVALFFAGVVMLITGRGEVLNAVSVMLVGWFVHSSAVASYQTGELTSVLSSARVAELMVRSLGRLDRAVVADQSSTDLSALWGPEYYVVTHEGRDIGVFALSSTGLSADHSDASRSVLDLIVPVHPEIVLDESASAMDALRLFLERDLQWVPVMREAEVVGVVRRLDVAEYVERNRR